MNIDTSKAKKEMKEKGQEYLMSKNKTIRITPVGAYASQFILNK